MINLQYIFSSLDAAEVSYDCNEYDEACYDIYG